MISAAVALERLRVGNCAYFASSFFTEVSWLLISSSSKDRD
jgi:hypothetical protein